MKNDKTYLEQLRELYETYTGKELEASLGVTVRSIQNYLKPKDPTAPSKEVINKIREVYANHQGGGGVVIKNPGSDSQDFKDKYITLLEDSLRENKATLEEVKKSLAQMPLDMMALTTKMIEIQSQLTEELREGQKAIHRDIVDLKSASQTSGKKLSQGQKH